MNLLNTRKIEIKGLHVVDARPCGSENDSAVNY
jgi:hypothetical protein